jgi:hypothetical protein
MESAATLADFAANALSGAALGLTLAFFCSLIGL